MQPQRDVSSPRRIRRCEQLEVSELVARALAGDPSVLLAGEPTGNLDTENGEAVMEMLANLDAEGATIIMVTHDRRFARYAGRTIGLLDGRLMDSPERV